MSTIVYVLSRLTLCAIKGNISGFTGECIYHYYDKTRINWRKGERWFCTEWEAIAGGCRKAKV